MRPNTPKRRARGELGHALPRAPPGGSALHDRTGRAGVDQSPNSCLTKSHTTKTTHLLMIYSATRPVPAKNSLARTRGPVCAATNGGRLASHLPFSPARLPQSWASHIARTEFVVYTRRCGLCAARAARRLHNTDTTRVPMREPHSPSRHQQPAYVIVPQGGPLPPVCVPTPLLNAAAPCCNALQPSVPRCRAGRRARARGPTSSRTRSRATRRRPSPASTGG
jgi:hypothetical protein